MDQDDGGSKQGVNMVCIYYRLPSQEEKVDEDFKQLEETSQLHVFMGEFWEFAGRAEQQRAGNPESMKEFFSAGTPLSSEVALLDVVWIKEEMDRDMKADDSLGLSD